MRKIRKYTAFYKTDDSINSIDFCSQHSQRSPEFMTDIYRCILDREGPAVLRQAIITGVFKADSLDAMMPSDREKGLCR